MWLVNIQIHITCLTQWLAETRSSVGDGSAGLRRQTLLWGLQSWVLFFIPSLYHVTLGHFTLLLWDAVCCDVSISFSSRCCAVPPFRTKTFRTPSGWQCWLLMAHGWASLGELLSSKGNWLVTYTPSLGAGRCRGTKCNEANLGHIWRAFSASELSHGISCILGFIVNQFASLPNPISLTPL